MVKLKIAHDTLLLPSASPLVIATDNSGAIGEKEFDAVNVPYEVVGYYLLRVVLMECVAAGGHPEALILQNFNGNQAWAPLVKGIHQGLEEANIPSLPITGSTESNFELQQSATSLSLIGRQKYTADQPFTEKITTDYRIAVIGKPLVGAEVLQNPADIASLKSFIWLSQQSEVAALLPVGSKGIRAALEKVAPNLAVQFPAELDVDKSSGPATCYVVIYEKNFYQTMTTMLVEPFFSGS